MTLRIGNRARIVLAWLSTLAPAALIAVLIAGNAVDTLFMDDWDLVGTTLIEARSGRLGLSQLFAQHNESRPLVPRLLFLAIGSVARGDTRWLLLLSFALACLVSFSVFKLARATLTASLPQIAGLTFVANLLIFTPKQAEIWLWCSYVGLEPVACLAASLALLQSGLGSWKRFAGSAVLCTVATFSYANGLSTWVLVAPVLALALGRRWLIAWTAGFLSNALLYFHGYLQPPGLPLSAAPLSDGFAPLLLGHYVLAFLGASLAVNRPVLATTVGAILSALFVLASLYGLRHAHDVSLRRRLLPWLSIGAYSILGALAAAVGRSRFGAEHAMANRYIPFSLYLGLALVFAVPIVLQHARADGWARGRWRLASVSVAAALVLGLGLHAASAVVGVGELIWEGRMLRYGQELPAVHPRPAGPALPRGLGVPGPAVRGVTGSRARPAGVPSPRPDRDLAAAGHPAAWTLGANARLLRAVPEEGRALRRQGMGGPANGATARGRRRPRRPKAERRLGALGVRTGPVAEAGHRESARCGVSRFRLAGRTGESRPAPGSEGQCLGSRRADRASRPPRGCLPRWRPPGARGAPVWRHR